MVTLAELLGQVPFGQRPMTAGPSMQMNGRDELGNPTMRDVLGQTYMADYSAFEPQQAAPGPMANDPRGLRVPDGPVMPRSGTGASAAPPAFVGNIVSALTQGMTAPAQAARGEPVTMGDVMSTAMDYGIMGAPMSAPEGALRANSFRAYHGSPHSFDQFDLGKIGTGEGAQAYGHGLYFAENEGIARAYRDTLSGGNIPARNFSTADGIVPDLGAVWQGGYDAAKAAVPMRSDAARAIATQMQDWVEGGRQAETFMRFNRVPDEYAPAYQAAADAWRGVRYRSNPGSMYEVQINADPDTFLDWDAPLPEGQAYDIYRELSGGMDATQQELADMFYNMQPGQMTGEDAYRWIGNTADRGYVPDGVFTMPTPEGSRIAAETLRNSDMSGIRYLDAGSRAAGDGSRNFVVFDDKLITILRKYGIGAAAVGGGWTLTPEEYDAAIAGGT